jgi:hypothetical protein
MLTQVAVCFIIRLNGVLIPGGHSRFDNDVRRDSIHNIYYTMCTGNASGDTAGPRGLTRVEVAKDRPIVSKTRPDERMFIQIQNYPELSVPDKVTLPQYSSPVFGEYENLTRSDPHW